MDSAYSALMSMEAKIIHDVMISRYFAAAALVLVMYDATITIDDEVGGSLVQATECCLLLLSRSA